MQTDVTARHSILSDKDDLSLVSVFSAYVVRATIRLLFATGAGLLKVFKFGASKVNAGDWLTSGPLSSIQSDDDMSPYLRWPSGLKREPPLGAHLATSRRGYSHHGVYVGHGWVVHYSGLSEFWQCGPVEEVSLARFANGHPVRIVHHAQSPYLAEEIVGRARSRLGENDYRLLTNNCEHFCNWCVSGINISTQVARPLRLPFRVLGALFHA
jgi:hypothetical protein